MEPLTALMSEEKMKKKIEQQKAKAPPPGASRILARATRENKKLQKPMPVPTPTPPPPAQTKPETQVQQSNASKQNQAASKSEQRPHSAKNNEPSDLDEWQALNDELNPEINPDLCEKYIQDEAFIVKLKQRLVSSKGLMLDGKVEGASVFRELCKILCSLVSIQFNDDEEAPHREADRYHLFVAQIKSLEGFCNTLELPQFFTELLKHLLNDKTNKNLKQVIFFI